MLTKTDLWLVVGVREDTPWEWGFLTVRGGGAREAAMAAARFTKEISLKQKNEELRIGPEHFPTSWEVTELLLAESHSGVVMEHVLEEECRRMREGCLVSHHFVQGETVEVRL